MQTTIFVPMLASDAIWIFCHAREAFDQGLLNAEGKVLRGFHRAVDAVRSFEEKQPQEPFAVMHVSFDKIVHGALSIAGMLVGTGQDAAGRKLWVLTREGCNRLHASGNCQLLMEIVPVQRTGICLY